MCGIFGAINIGGLFEAKDAARFRELNDLTAYRGPNDSGTATFRFKSESSESDERFDVFLGNRRLSIVDLSANGHQPMTDGNGCWITFNGEIFNYLELRRELEQKGHVFNTGTDTEVILHIYSEYGEEGFSKLNGMWAFAIADSHRRRVVLSRDRFSIKPLYILREEHRLFFASEIKQLLPLMPSRKLNVETMSAFLSQGLLDHSLDTFFTGITKAPPRTNIVVSLNSGVITESNYWQFDGALPTAKSDDVVQEFRELFLDSIKLRLRSDVKSGVLLSGGLDSSSIAVGCSAISTSPETYSIVSEDGLFDESRFIKCLNGHGGRNHKIIFRPDDILNDLSTVLYHNDEPVSGFSCIAQHKLFRAIKEESDVTVLLSGQGGDEVLLGYLKFFFFYVKTLYREQKYSQAIIQLLASMWSGTAVSQFSMRSARRYVRSMNSKDRATLKVKATAVPIWECKDIRSRQIADIEKYSVPVLAHYEDRNSMAHSLEVRHPFLDHRLVDFALSLPVEDKIKNGWTKYILRQAMTELPDPIRWRRDKQGFLTPEQKWLKADLAPVIRKDFQRSRLSEAGLIDDQSFLNYYENFRSGAAVPHNDISRTFIAEQWMKQAFPA